METGFNRDGIVDIDNRKLEVFFHFIDEDTILCKDKHNLEFIFYTHYKSLIYED